MNHYQKPPPVTLLTHYGVKGMKWGVRRTKEELRQLRREVEKSGKPDIIKTVVTGHAPSPKRAAPYAVIDHAAEDGSVKARSFYDKRGWKTLDIHTTNHGHPAQHKFGIHGEHVDLYQWNEDGSLKRRTRRDLTEKERKENEDIL